jgi:hypothetical protein
VRVAPRARSPPGAHLTPSREPARSSARTRPRCLP